MKLAADEIERREKRKAAPAKPRWEIPPQVWRDIRRWLICGVPIFVGFGGVILLPRAAPAAYHAFFLILCLAALLVAGGLGIFWKSRDRAAERARMEGVAAITELLNGKEAA